MQRTRSGKISRRLIKAVVLGKELEDTSALENPKVSEEITEATKT
ncbi:MAG: hypothetical protein QMD13_02415 [Candidatus Bathyarchaeia archaeon]|nr:hypothetical protein [Candidatus Bathyarchaeia archaeon]